MWCWPCVVGRGDGERASAAGIDELRSGALCVRAYSGVGPTLSGGCTSPRWCRRARRPVTRTKGCRPVLRSSAEFVRRVAQEERRLAEGASAGLLKELSTGLTVVPGASELGGVFTAPPGSPSHECPCHDVDASHVSLGAAYIELGASDDGWQPTEPRLKAASIAKAVWQTT
jgi:hypothetical protein